jgi:Trk K+ transport system NAD-binding subunit
VSGAIFIALRRLRAPIIVLILVYAVGMLGMVLIPGRDADGNTWRMGFFHAFYFVSYTASTIGFGEIPHAFTDAQRLWTTAVIYMSVIGWAYVIASILALRADQAFLVALQVQRFAREVRRLADPFYVLCGFGETGSLICEALDRTRLRVVVVEIDAARVAEVDLQGFSATIPALNADARVPGNLLLAGIAHPRCRGVLAMTDDDNANLAVAIAVRLLNPGIPVLARSRSEEASANMASFGTDCIINPFALFGEYLSLLLRAPRLYHLLDRLVGSAASPEIADRAPPRGHWIVCGYGRFGREVVASFDRERVDVTIIDPDPPADSRRTVIRGAGTEAEPLRAAGIETAVGIVAGTDDDVNNLSIAVTARNIKPALYVVVRQNHTANNPLFAAYGADFTVVSRALIAEHCIALVRTPLLGRFIRRIKAGDEESGGRILEQIERKIGDKKITAWDVTLTPAGAAAVDRALAGGGVVLEVLLRDPTRRDAPLAAVPLLLVRVGEEMLLPPDGLPLQRGDQLLFAGTNESRELQLSTLVNSNVLDYVMLGCDIPGGWVWEHLARRLTTRAREAAD